MYAIRSYYGCMAKMVDLYGGAGLANFPIEEQPVDEFITTTKENTAGAVFSEVAVHIHNRSAWPARMTDKLSFRYYVDLSEGFDRITSYNVCYTKLLRNGTSSRGV